MDGDEIYLTAGTFTGSGAAVISLTHNITVYGGWDGAGVGLPVVDPESYRTVLDGAGARRVLSISGASPHLSGLALQNGDATGLGGDPFAYDVGGAVFVTGTNPVIVNCHIYSSSAVFGGGLAFSSICNQK